MIIVSAIVNLVFSVKSFLLLMLSYKILIQGILIS